MSCLTYRKTDNQNNLNYKKSRRKSPNLDTSIVKTDLECLSLIVNVFRQAISVTLKEDQEHRDHQVLVEL